MSTPPQSENPLCETGIEGFDEILKGGFPPNRLYLLRGQPGVGKTTLAMQFLLRGEARGQHALYITLSETAAEISDIAKSHDWDLAKLSIFELSALEKQLSQDSQNSVFHPAEIELNRTTELLLKTIEDAKPARVVLDSLSELRLLSDSQLRFRRQILALKQFFAGRAITVLFLDDHSVNDDQHVQSIAHGVVTLDGIVSDYGAARRRISINKLRGVDFVGGYHDMVIRRGGIEVFPRLVASDHKTDFAQDTIRSGINQLDALLGGGIDRGTSCLILGPAGTGKSSIAAQFAVVAAEREEKVLICLFEETTRNLITRSGSISSPIKEHIDSGRIIARQIDPAELAPGQFVNYILQSVEKEGVRMLIIDSINGYLQAMPDVKFLNIQLHELFAYLSNRGIVTLATVAQFGIASPYMSGPIDLTYLADTVILLRYFEHAGGIKKALSILKKRTGRHENTIRELRVDDQGIRVGEALHQFEGVLTGVPKFKGTDDRMLGPRE